MTLISHLKWGTNKKLKAHIFSIAQIKQINRLKITNNKNKNQKLIRDL